MRRVEIHSPSEQQKDCTNGYETSEGTTLPFSEERGEGKIINLPVFQVNEIVTIGDLVATLGLT